jgi:hypothetical protein
MTPGCFVTQVDLKTNSLCWSGWTWYDVQIRELDTLTAPGSRSEGTMEKALPSSESHPGLTYPLCPALSKGVTDGVLLSTSILRAWESKIPNSMWGDIEYHCATSFLVLRPWSTMSCRYYIQQPRLLPLLIWSTQKTWIYILIRQQELLLTFMYPVSITRNTVWSNVGSLETMWGTLAPTPTPDHSPLLFPHFFSPSAVLAKGLGVCQAILDILSHSSSKQLSEAFSH